MHPVSVQLSVTLSPPKPLGRIQPNLLHHFPLMVRVYERWLGCMRAILFFHVSVCPCIHHPSICLSHYLLINHWAEFNQTCYIISPSWLGCMRAILFFHVSVCPCIHHPSICLSHYLLLNHLVEFNQTWPPLMEWLWESKSIHLSC